MTYRDDREADQARITALEAELAAARETIDELEGKRSNALVLAGSRELASTGKPTSSAARWLGAPLTLERMRRFEGAFPSDRFEDLIEVIREATRDRGRTELLRSSMTWWASSSDRGMGPFTSVTVSVKGGATTLTVSDRLGHLAGGVFGGFGGGVGGGLILAPVGATLLAPILAPVFFLSWFGGIYAASRAIFKRAARRRAEQLNRLYEAVEAEIARALSVDDGDRA